MLHLLTVVQLSGLYKVKTQGAGTKSPQVQKYIEFINKINSDMAA